MLKEKLFRSRLLAIGLVAAFLLLTVPLPGVAGSPQAGPSVKPGTLQGNLFSEGMKSRVPGAVVKIRNIDNQKEFVSRETDDKGGFLIAGIEEGWYLLGVTAPGGDFNLNYRVFIKGGETAKLSLEMKTGGVLEGKDALGKGKGFFAKAGGILLLVAAGTGTVFGVYRLATDEGEVSAER